MLKKIGSWIGSAKRYLNNVQNQVSDITNIETDVKEDDVPKEQKDKNV